MCPCATVTSPHSAAERPNATPPSSWAEIRIHDDPAIGGARHAVDANRARFRQGDFGDLCHDAPKAFTRAILCPAVRQGRPQLAFPLPVETAR
jgi:hypothetical protein